MLAKYEFSCSGTEKLMSRKTNEALFMKKITNVLLLIVIISVFSSCASIVSRTSWPLNVNTTPSGAKVEITDRKGAVVFSGLSPAFMKLRSGDGFFVKQSYTVKLTMDGYAEKIIPVDCTLNGWYIGNVFFGGLIGILIVDPATGAMYRLDREFIEETLIQNTSSTGSSLKVVDISSIPESAREHLVCLK